MYKQKSYDLGDIREVMEYHNGRYGAPGMPRMKKKKATPEQIRRRISGIKNGSAGER